MERNRMTLILLLLAVFFGFTGVSHASSMRDWLVLFYINGNNDLGLNGSVRNIINFCEKFDSSDQVAIVVKYSSLSRGSNNEIQFPRQSQTILIRKDNGDPEITSPVTDSSPVVDMAGKLSLTLFLRKTILKYPARKLMLVICGKGAGIEGLLQDDISRSKMSVKTLGEALSEVRKKVNRKIDLLVLSAEYMQSAEVIYELKDEAEFIIGSEASLREPSYEFDLCLEELFYDSQISSQTLANSVSYFSNNPVTSVVKASEIPGFMNRLDQWVESVLTDPAAVESARIALNKSPTTEFTDLVDFIDRSIGTLPPDSAAVKKGTLLKDFIQNALVIAYNKSNIDPKTLVITPSPVPLYGIGIYLPRLVYSSEVYESLSFSEASGWRKLVLRLIEENLKKTDTGSGK